MRPHKEYIIRDSGYLDYPYSVEIWENGCNTYSEYLCESYEEACAWVHEREGLPDILADIVHADGEQ